MKDQISLFNNFIYVAGPFQEVISFACAVCDEEYQPQLESLISELSKNEKYVSFYMDQDVYHEFEWRNFGRDQLVDIDEVVASFSELIAKYYKCEFLYYSVSRYNGMYFMSSAGGKTISSSDYLYFPEDNVNNRSWFDDPDYLTALLNGIFVDAHVTIHLRNGKKFSYIDESKHGWRYDVLEAFHPVFTIKLTFDKIAELLCDYYVEHKMQEFFQKMRKNFQSIDQIKSIEITQKKLYASDRLDNEKLCDPTVVRYLSSVQTEESQVIFNFTKNTAKKKCIRQVTAYRNPENDEFSMDVIELENSDEREIQIPGLCDPNEPAICYTPKGGREFSVLYCLTNAETIKIPSSVYGWDEVTSIAKGAFKDLDNIKEIYLPDTIPISNIASGAFEGCKNLKYIGYINQSNEENILINKAGDKLLQYISGKDIYIVSEDIRTLDNYVFSNCNRLKKVVLHGKMKRLLNHSLDKCKSLTTLEIHEGYKKINTTALENSKIKEVILPTVKIKIYDKYQLQFFVEGKKTVSYDFLGLAKAVNQCLLDSKKRYEQLPESKGIRIAEDLIRHHAKEIADELSKLLTAALCYYVIQGDAKKLGALLKKAPLEIADNTVLSECADKKGNHDIIALLEEFGLK